MFDILQNRKILNITPWSTRPTSGWGGVATQATT